MKDMNDIVNKMVEDIEIPEDVPVAYEVWAIGYDEEDELTGAAMVLGTFDDPDQAVSFARDTVLADVVHLAADDDYDDLTVEAHSVSIEVETVVPSDDEDEMNMNVGTIYKKRIEIYEELPDFVVLAPGEYIPLEDGNIMIPGCLLKEHEVNDKITIVFEEGLNEEDESCPIEYKIIFKSDCHYICEFV